MKNFTQIPNELFEPSALTIQERYLYCVLLKYCRQDESCFPSQKILSTDLGLSERQVRTILKGLADKGMIKKIRRGKFRSNVYMMKTRVTNRNSASHQTSKVRTSLPMTIGSSLPPTNTQGNIHDYKSSKIGMQSLREKMAELYPGLYSPLDNEVNKK